MVVEKGYKQTEVGAIPEEWEVKPLEDYFIYISYGFTNPMPISENGVFLVTAKDIVNGEINYTTARFTPDWAYRKLITEKSRPKYGDLLLTKDGTLGRLAIVGEKRICINQSVAVLRPKKEVNVKFLKYLLQSNFYQKVMIENAGGSTIKHIYITVVNRMKIGMPNRVLEQAAIAQALSDIDTLIAHTEKLIEKKKAIKQGIMQELLKPKEGWETKKLRDICKFYKGKGLPKTDLSEGGRYECIHYGELFLNYGECIKEVRNKTNNVNGTFLSIENDVLMPTSDVTPNGLATASCIKKSDVVIGGDILVIRADKDLLDGVFLSYIIRLNKETVLQMVSGSTVYHLYGSDMARFVISLPTIETQKNITQVLTDLSNQINALKYKLIKIRLKKQGMMQSLLTGKIRLA